MRIERFRVGAFGRLGDLDSGAAPLPGLVVVTGPNEAGKSTLFHFLTSMLYGFYPASRDGNPYAPWDGAEPSGSVSLRLDGGACVAVERRLLSQPTGRMQTGGRTEELRNRTLPWAEHVPRAVFHQVFAVTLHEMASLDEETWARVQDRILGAMGSADLRPARHVVAELEQEAGEMWRPTRRGHQRARLLEDEARTLRAQRREAAERDRSLRALVAEVEGVRRQLQETREARQAARLAVDRIQALRPVRAQLQRIEALRDAAGPPAALEGLPTDPAAALDAHRSGVVGLRRRLEELAVERAEPAAAVGALGETDGRILARSEEVSAFVARGAALLADRERLLTLEQELRDLARRLDDAASQVLAAPLDPEVERGVLSVSVAELRERVRALQAARDEGRRGKDVAPTPSAVPASPLPSAAVALAGIVLVAAGLSGSGALVTAVGGALAVLGGALLLQWLRTRRGGTPAALPAAAGPEPREREALAAVSRLLDGLPVLPSLLADPTEALTAGLHRAQELARDRRERAGTAEELRRRLADADAEATRLAGDLGRGAGLDAAALASLLERELRGAERAAERAAAAARELARLDREEARTRAELEAAERELERLLGRLAGAGAGDAEHGLPLVRDRIRARDRADQLLDELERAHPDLEELRARIRADEEQGELWPTDDEDLARRKAAVEELTQRVEELATRAESLDKDVAQLRSAPTVDALDGGIAALEEEERALLAERDRRWVMAQLLREADRRFREEHQPDVLRRAGEHIRSLTGGRYDRLMVDESTGSGSFQLVGPGLPVPVPLARPVSTGTLEQAYLALRLAIVDHLDQGLERLPLFVDEVFVNWDEARRRRGMALLGGMSAHRQIFVFTCHDDVADELRGHGAAVLDLHARR